MKLYQKLPEPRPIERYDIVIGRGVEPEVGAMLYALVRLIKPRILVETGTHVGDSASWIGRALYDNARSGYRDNFGSLVTCDIDQEKVDNANRRFQEEGIGQYVRAVCSTGQQLIESYGNCEGLGLAHVDSGAYDVRKAELMSLGDHNIIPGGVVCYHDASRDMVGIYEEFAQVRDWPHLILPSYVGMAVFMRPEK